MKLRDRVGLIFGTVLATLLIVVVLTGGSYLMNRQERSTIDQRVGPIMEACRQMERLADHMIEDQFIYLKDEAARLSSNGEFWKHLAEFDQAFVRANQAARNPMARALLEEIAAARQQAEASHRQMVAQVERGQVVQASREHRGYGRPLVQMRDNAEKLYTGGIQVVTELDEEALRRGNLAFRLAFLVALVGAAIAAYLWRQTSQDLVEPLRDLQLAAGELAQGRFIQATNPRAERVEELEALQRGFNLMSARLQAMARSLQDANTALEGQVAERTAELQRMVEELRTVDRLKSDFMANVSHELLTPLNFIVGFGSTLEDGLHGPLNPEQRATLAKMLAGADRLTRMVRNTLEYTEIQAGRLAVRQEDVDYGPLLRRLAGDAAPILAARDQELVLEIPADLPAIRGDGDRLRKVLEELLDNASRFSPQGATLRLGVQVGPDLVTTELVDPGQGIPAEALPHLFTPFYQANTTRTREHTGMGLGLAIAYHFVAKMGGSMLVSSQPGKGTAIRFSLPRAAAVASPQASRQAAAKKP